MKINQKQTVLLILSLFAFSAMLSGQRLDKTIDKSFKADKSTTLNIQSKFGEVKVLSGDSDDVKVVVEMWVESSREEKAASILESLDAEISQTGDEILVKSILPDRLNTGANTKFGIDITVHAPEYINLELSSKYGSAYVESVAGLAHISVAYGSLKAGELSRAKVKPLNHIDLAYSSGSLQETGWLKLDLAYSKFNIEEAQALMVISKYSGLNLEECSSVVMESKYDSYAIEELNNFMGELKYGNLKIGELSRKLEVSSKYSSVKVGEIGPDFELIKIENSRGGYKLGISADASFRLKGYAQSGDISVSGMDDISKRSENSDKYIEGVHGSNPKAEIDIEVQSGSVKIVLD